MGNNYQQNNNGGEYQKKYRYGKRPLWQWILIYIVVAAIVYGAIYYFFFAKNGGYNDNPSPYQNNNSNQNTTTILVSMSSSAFNPSSITIQKGTKVTWKNNDSVSHTVIGDNGGPASQYINPGDSYEYTFTTTGAFSYYCSLHPDMRGMVQVTD